MNQLVYRYSFGADVPIKEAEATLLLAVLAAEGLHGEAEVRLEGSHSFDPERRSCLIDAATAVGRDINRLFVSFIRHEFGAGAFQVERVDAVHHHPATEAHS
jgi:hypothetical protein